MTDSQSAGRVYFNTMARLQEAIARRDYEHAADTVRCNLKEIPAFVRSTVDEYGSFDISSIPALQQGGTILALLNDEEGLLAMRRLVASMPELKRWTTEMTKHEQDRASFLGILEAVGRKRECSAADVAASIGSSDRRHLATLISYLEKAGKLARSKDGRRDSLTIRSPVVSTAIATKSIMHSHRLDHSPLLAQEIRITDIPYVPLPRVPPFNEPKDELASRELFAVQGADWQLSSVREIPMTDRPDTAFRQTYTLDSGTLLVDDLGNARGLGSIGCAALRYDRLGVVAAQAGFAHDLYRIGVNPAGRGVIMMSRDSAVRAYCDDFEVLFATVLADAPEVVALSQRYSIPRETLKNHIRCVALSRDNARYLFTIVDQAFCVGVDGRGLWGSKLPIKSGWSSIASPSSGCGTGNDVSRALELMSLSLPIRLDDIKRRYRELAKQWHPDVNPRDLQAHERMTALNAAAELLSGVDAREFARSEGVRYVQDESRHIVNVGPVTITIGIETGELGVADWVYAANFSAVSDALYLVGYSGRLIVINGEGRALRAYDIGSVPSWVCDNTEFLYVLAGWRLYILKDDALHGLVDTQGRANLLVTGRGFGLVEKTRFKWFAPNGAFEGAVATRDPIRRAYYATEGLIIETRKHRAHVSGAPVWWDLSATTPLRS